MAKDDRIYAKFSTDMLGHPKWLVLSDAAKVALFEAILWSRERMSDGLLPPAWAERQWSKEVLLELCNNDPEAPSLHRVRGGYKIHDYGEHQTTKAELEAWREQHRVAGAAGGRASAAKRAQVNGQAPAQAPAKARAKAPAKAVAKAVAQAESKREREGENGDLGGGVTFVNATPKQPPPSAPATPQPPPCPKHPDGPHHAEPCRMCAAMRRYAASQEEARAQAEHDRYEHQRVIDNCGMCNHQGQICLDDEHWVPCTHQHDQAADWRHFRDGRRWRPYPEGLPRATRPSRTKEAT